MEIWQQLLPKKILVKSEWTARTLGGQLGFRVESARIRWGTVKTSLALSRLNSTRFVSIPFVEGNHVPILPDSGSHRYSYPRKESCASRSYLTTNQVLTLSIPLVAKIMYVAMIVNPPLCMNLLRMSLSSASIHLRRGGLQSGENEVWPHLTNRLWCSVWRWENLIKYSLTCISLPFLARYCGVVVILHNIFHKTPEIPSSILKSHIYFFQARRADLVTNNCPRS